MTDDDKIDVIYILGSGHSGSTLLDRILGSNTHIFSCGELSFYNIVKDNIPHPKARHKLAQNCSCGKSLKKCSFWGLIVSIEKGRIKIKKNYTKKDNLRYFNEALNVKKIKPKKKSNSDFDLFSLIKKRAGCEMILDSSKDPRRLLDLYKEPPN